MPADANRGQTIAAIERAADVLTLFAKAGEATLGITEIASELKLSKAVVYRILSSFRAKGYVAVDEGTRRYTLGPRALELGLAYLSRIDVRAMARPELERLSAETNETATLSIRAGWDRVYIDQVTPERDVKMVASLGRSAPLHAGAPSKALLAFLPDAEIEQFLAAQQLESRTAKTQPTERQLRKELAVIRKRGYAVSVGEGMSGAGAVAAPIFGHEGQPVAVMSVSGPAERFKDEIEQVAPLLVETTARLSHLMGHRAA